MNLEIIGLYLKTIIITLLLYLKPIIITLFMFSNVWNPMHPWWNGKY